MLAVAYARHVPDGEGLNDFMFFMGVLDSEYLSVMAERAEAKGK